MYQNIIPLTEEVIVDYIKGKTPAGTSEVDDLIIYGVGGKTHNARTHSQRDLVKAYDKHDLMFAIGPAGSGKTYTAIALAVKALKNKSASHHSQSSCSGGW